MSTPPFRVALNGYGRIGRCVLRALHERPEQLGFEIVALNDLADQASVEYLTRFDSTHGRFPGEVKVDGDCLHINGDCVKVLRSPTPEAIDWQALRVDLVLECSGQYTNRAQAERFLRAGAPRVLFSQPMASEADIDAEYKKLQDLYTFNPQENSPEKFESSVRYQLREYLGIKKFLDDKGYTAFSTNFEDLKGLKQLPGLAAQLLMRDGYGFGAEGDWKTSALTRLLKIMAHNDRTVFMEDYTLDLRKGHEAILGAHMLEVDPTIASDKPRVEVHPLDIGGKDDPARLVFTGADGEGIDCTVADFRDGFRLISYPVDCRKAEAETPHLPVAKQLWTPKVGLKKGATAWIHAGGGHHTVLSFRITEEQIHDLGTMLGMNLVEIC